MAHKVMPPPFTSEQLEMIEGMIAKAVSDLDASLDWSEDIEDAVQSAASDVQHSVDMLSNTVGDAERAASTDTSGSGRT